MWRNDVTFTQRKSGIQGAKRLMLSTKTPLSLPWLVCFATSAAGNSQSFYRWSTVTGRQYNGILQLSIRTA